MKKKSAIFTLLFCIILVCKASMVNASIHPNDISTELIHQLYADWKQAEKNDTKHNKYSIQEWKNIFEKTKDQILLSKDTSIQLKVNLALATIYHDLTIFEKGLPLLENLYAHKQKLTTNEYKSVLIKLEEEYRSKNIIDKALKIRKERIDHRFIHTYWEIYRDCGLFEAAKRDYIAFEPIPPPLSEKRLKYYGFLGGLLIEMGEIDSAKKVLLIGLEEANKAIQSNNQSKSYSNENLLYWKGYITGLLANCDIQQGNFNDVLPKLLFNLSTTGVNIDNKMEVYNMLCATYIHLKDFNKAQKALQELSNLMKGKTLKFIQREYLKNKSDYFKAINHYDSAFFYLNAYSNYKDILQQNVQKNQSILLLAELEISNRRKELIESKTSLEKIEKLTKKQRTQLIWLVSSLGISILFGIALYFNIRQKNKNKKHILAQNEQLKINSINIAEQNKHNEVLLKELHHRVKNNLQVINSLLNIQKRRNTDLELKEIISAVQTRIQTMALVHQNLYNSGDFENVDVNYYVKNLVSQLQSLYKIDEQKVRIEFDIQTSLQIHIEKIIPLGLMINEAVSNAFKYAFKEINNGLLQINIEQFGQTLNIEIIDNGPGYKEIDIKEGSIGLQLIHIMCTQLNASYEVEHQNGVMHKIEFTI